MQIFHSLEDICSYMQTNLQYTSEQQREQSRHHGHQWKRPAETLKDGFGYCYDLAAFALAAIEASNLGEAKLLLVCWDQWGKKSNSGHFVCVYPDQSQNEYLCIDNGFLKGPLSFAELLQVAARNNTVLSYRWFEAHEIPYHTKYSDMAGFLK